MSAAKNGKSPGGCGNSQPGQNVRKVCEPSYAPIIACITAAFIIELCLLWFFFSSVPVITTYVPYTVQRNDTLWDIAKKFHTTVENIVTTNELPGEQVKTGQRLLLVKEVGV